MAVLETSEIALKETTSYCDHCLKKISAVIFKKDNGDGKIYIRKTCDEHGSSAVIYRWDSEELYKFMTSLEVAAADPGGIFIEVTKQCNLECPVCFNGSGPNITWHNPKIHPNVYSSYENIYLTGGEPTMRKDLPEIIASFKAIGKTVLIVSNGIKLADRQYVQKLKKAGLNCVMLQFDGFDDKIVEQVRGRPLLAIKKKAIKNLTDLNIIFSMCYCVPRQIDLEYRQQFLDLATNFRALKMISFIPVTECGRSTMQFPETSGLVDNLAKLFQFEHEDFYASTRLLLNADSLHARISGIKKRRFSKCFITSIVLIKNNEVVPLRKIVDVAKLNKILPTIKTKGQFIRFFLKWLFVENSINFFKNRYCRMLCWEMVKKLKFLFIDRLLMNPFLCVTLSRFQSLHNYDTECNNFCARDYLHPTANTIDCCCHYINTNMR